MKHFSFKTAFSWIAFDHVKELNPHAQNVLIQFKELGNLRLMWCNAHQLRFVSAEES